MSTADANSYPPIKGYPVSDAAKELWDELQRLDLAPHIAELEVMGFTVVPPEKVAPPDFAPRMLAAALRLCERRTGSRPAPDITEANTPEAMKAAFGQPIAYSLLEEPLFQESLLNPVALAFITYLLGRNALLSGYSVMFKGPGGIDLPLHADSWRLNDPLPALPQIANITWALTDYSRENGSICFVPGSQRYLRRPLENEGLAERVAVNARAGSLIIFGGQVWHGAFARTAPGYRCAISMYLCRPHQITQEAYGREVPQEIIDRHPPRFATLMGRRIDYGWKQDGPQKVDSGSSASVLMGMHAWD